MPIANYTTEMSVDRSLNLVVTLLRKAGVETITHRYDGPLVVGIDFAMQTDQGWRPYRLPVRVEGVQRTLVADGVAPRYRTREHAARVAWKIAHDWLRAQLALIEAGMTTMPEVMFPYALLGDMTAYETFQARELER